MSLLVTAGPPTTNGDLHIGHLAGPYVAADVFRSYHQMRGVETLLLTGTDDHQSYVETMAQDKGISCTELASQASDVIRESLRLAGTRYDAVVVPHREHAYAVAIRRIVADLMQSEALKVDTRPAPYDPESGRFVFEAHVRGQCPACGTPCDGGLCEACGMPNAGHDLIEPTSRDGARLTTRPMVRLWMDLEVYRKAIEDHCSRAVMSAHMRSLCSRMLAGTLPRVPVSHEGRWGLPLPGDRMRGHRLSAWFELSLHYLGILAVYGEAIGRDWRELWASHEVVQCFGFDSTYFHAVLQPAVFSAWGQLQAPRAFISNEFFRLDGKKFSTSRRHALWAGEFLQSAEPESLRMYLAHARPEEEQTNFTVSEFEAYCDGEIDGSWTAWIERLAGRKRFARGGARATSSPAEEALRTRLQSLALEVESAYELQGFSLRRVARSLSMFVETANQHALRAANCATTGPYASESTLAYEVSAAQLFATLVRPLMPGFSARMARRLGFDEPVAWTTKLRAPSQAELSVGAMPLSGEASVGGGRTE